jgi:hypothetical protein
MLCLVTLLYSCLLNPTQLYLRITKLDDTTLYQSTYLGSALLPICLSQVDAPDIDPTHQKNWAPFMHKGSLHFIQQVNPLQIVSIDEYAAHRITSAAAEAAATAVADAAAGANNKEGYPKQENFTHFTARFVAIMDAFMLFGFRFKIKVITTNLTLLLCFQYHTRLPFAPISRSSVLL